GAWVSMQWNFAFALLMLLGGTYAYSLRQIGGGDLKLLAVAFLWTGPWFAAPFVILLLIFTGAYYVAVRLGFAAAQRTAVGLRIPLAPSLAAAAPPQPAAPLPPHPHRSAPGARPST